MRKSDWSYHNPVRVVAGHGAVNRIVELVPADSTVLLVTTAGFVGRGTAQRLAELLDASRVVTFAEVTPNPDLDGLDAACARLAGGNAITAIVGLGGGSVIDAAKALSVALPSGLSRPLDTVLRGAANRPWQANLPVVAIPTTSGTGAEMTPFATVWDRTFHKKYSVAGPRVYPQTAVLDPELTVSLPADETLYTALDAVSHSLESLWNSNSTAVSEAFAEKALHLALDALPKVLARPGDIAARARMQQASSLAGLAISQTRTAIAHSISYPLTSHYDVPHGLACSFTLENLIRVYRQQNPLHPLLPLLSEVAIMLAGLELGKHMARYVSQDQINALQAEMYTPGRADNYDGQLGNLSDIIRIPG